MKKGWRKKSSSPASFSESAADSLNGPARQTNGSGGPNR